MTAADPAAAAGQHPIAIAVPLGHEERTAAATAASSASALASEAVPGASSSASTGAAAVDHSPQPKLGSLEKLLAKRKLQNETDGVTAQMSWNLNVVSPDARAHPLGLGT